MHNHTPTHITRRAENLFAEVKQVDIAQIHAARARIGALSIVTPLVGCACAPQGKILRLKLENLQTIGSFKTRPIANAVLSKDAQELRDGLYTSSSGNSGLAVAWMARHLGLQATAVVPADAPPSKLEKLRQLGAKIEVLSKEAWWCAIETGTLAELSGTYIDAVRDPASLAGDGTIGMEILEQWPEVEAIFVPFGGGGIACGIASAVRALKPGVKIIACELASANPLQSAFAAGRPVVIPHDAGFVSGIGYGQILPEMWPLARSLIDGVITVTLAQVARAIKLLAENNRVVAEGAGAVSVAAALAGEYPYGNVCAVVSGGNIDSEVFTAILRDRLPV